MQELKVWKIFLNLLQQNQVTIFLNLYRKLSYTFIFIFRCKTSLLLKGVNVLYFIMRNLIILDTSSESTTDFQKESGVGMTHYHTATNVVTTCSKKSKRKESYIHWSDKERFSIGKYAAASGYAAAVRKFMNKGKPLNESTVRRFCKRYKEEFKQSSKEKCELKKRLRLIPRGGPLMLGSLDEMVQKYLRAYRSRGGLVNSIIAISVTKVLTARNP